MEEASAVLLAFAFGGANSGGESYSVEKELSQEKRHSGCCALLWRNLVPYFQNSRLDRVNV